MAVSAAFAVGWLAGGLAPASGAGFRVAGSRGAPSAARPVHGAAPTRSAAVPQARRVAQRFASPRSMDWSSPRLGRDYLAERAAFESGFVGSIRTARIFASPLG